MAFLDNSGDIILDAVLTDTGRFRLAKGDGSFKIAKFALGDEEIDYSLYDKNNTSGSAYYDLNIMQTPVLEAFTNNASSMSSKLVSMARNNLLYLPIIKLNETEKDNQTVGTAADTLSDFFYVAVDQTTEDKIGIRGDWPSGYISGQTLTKSPCILLEQGLDTMEIPPNVALDADLVETQYILEMDNRLGSQHQKSLLELPVLELQALLLLTMIILQVITSLLIRHQIMLFREITQGKFKTKNSKILKQSVLEDLEGLSFTLKLPLPST